MAQRIVRLPELTVRSPHREEAGSKLQRILPDGCQGCFSESDAMTVGNLVLMIRLWDWNNEHLQPGVSIGHLTQIRVSRIRVYHERERL